MTEAVEEMVSGRPAPQLQPFVHRYVGYRIEGMQPGVHRGLPSRHLTMIISLSRPVAIAAMPDRRMPGDSFAALVGGLHAAPAIIEHDGAQHGIQLELEPLGAGALLGLPAGELASTVVPLEDVLGPQTHELVDRLTSAAEWPTRFAILDDVLTAALNNAATGTPLPSREVAWAWERLVATGGSIEVRTIADEVGWSRRHLGERFRRELGLTPKVVARVLRFERACESLRRPRRPGLAELAAMCGYFDQAHLTRDWHDLAGCTPTAWIREELPSVQDDPEPVGAA